MNTLTLNADRDRHFQRSGMPTGTDTFKECIECRQGQTLSTLGRDAEKLTHKRISRIKIPNFLRMRIYFRLRGNFSETRRGDPGEA